MLGHINDFYNFDFEGFIREKALEVVEISGWDEYKRTEAGKSEKTGVVLGSRVRASIIHDGTNYNLKDGEMFSNKFKDMIFKIRLPLSEVNIKCGDKIAGEAFSDQGGYYKPLVVSCKPYSTSGFGNNELSIEVSGFQKIDKKK